MKKILFVLCLGLVSIGYAQCISGDCENGTGTFKDGNGFIYLGEWKDGKFHGQGTITSASIKYVGEWKDGKMNGKGTFTIIDDGAEYVGEFKDGRREGHGTMTYGEGKYVGEYKDGKFHGQGTMNFADGRIWSGKWKKGEFKGKKK